MGVVVLLIGGNWGNCPGCPGSNCPTWVMVLGGSCLGGNGPWGSCPQSSCPRGSCPRGSCPQSSCPRGSCPRGSCPVTDKVPGTQPASSGKKNVSRFIQAS